MPSGKSNLYKNKFGTLSEKKKFQDNIKKLENDLDKLEEELQKETEKLSILKQKYEEEYKRENDLGRNYMNHDLNHWLFYNGYYEDKKIILDNIKDIYEDISNVKKNINDIKVIVSELSKTNKDSKKNQFGILADIDCNMLLCPLSYNIMTNPVVAGDGQTYDHSSIKRWIETPSSKVKDSYGRIIGWKSPLTGQTIKSYNLYTNQIMKQLINLKLSDSLTLKQKCDQIEEDEKKKQIIQLLNKQFKSFKK